MVIKTPSYSPGSLVQARDRNWVVLPADEEDVVILRPVDGSDEDSIGIFLPIEQDSISPSEYDWPNAGQAGKDGFRVNHPQNKAITKITKIWIKEYKDYDIW